MIQFEVKWNGEIYRATVQDGKVRISVPFRDRDGKILKRWRLIGEGVWVDSQGIDDVRFWAVNREMAYGPVFDSEMHELLTKFDKLFLEGRDVAG